MGPVQLHDEWKRAGSCSHPAMQRALFSNIRQQESASCSLYEHPIGDGSNDWWRYRYLNALRHLMATPFQPLNNINVDGT
jgi:hypothetical protein